MKNLHVLPTDKRSILSDCVNYKHVYITSDEKFVRDEYVTDGIEVIKATPKLVNAQGLVSRRNWRKIILTIDQDLIADGIQAIDDTFLEWFLENPSCESVEVEKWTDYKFQNNKEIVFFNYKIIIPQEEPKQETLEEAALRLYQKGLKDDLSLSFHDGVKFGAKWQEERMYSEEEVQLILSKLLTDIKNGNAGNSVEWFEQFKKKGGDK